MSVCLCGYVYIYGEQMGVRVRARRGGALVRAALRSLARRRRRSRRDGFNRLHQSMIDPINQSSIGFTRARQTP